MENELYARYEEALKRYLVTGSPEDFLKAGTLAVMLNLEKDLGATSSSLLSGGQDE